MITQIGDLDYHSETLKAQPTRDWARQGINDVDTGKTENMNIRDTESLNQFRDISKHYVVAHFSTINMHKVKILGDIAISAPAPRIDARDGH